MMLRACDKTQYVKYVADYTVKRMLNLLCHKVKNIFL